MKTVRPLLLLALLGVMCAGLDRASAVELDLKRTQPVAATEPIPIQDFFRPAALQTPQINLAGTHIGAIMVVVGEDKRRLMVYDLQAKKADFAGGNGEIDVNSFSWLDSNRVVYTMMERKQFDLGLFAANVGNLAAGYPLIQYYSSQLVAVPTANRLHPLVWNRYDFDTGHDIGVAAIDSGMNLGGFVNRMSAATANRDSNDSDLKARDHNEQHIVTRYPLPVGGIVYRYLCDKDGELEFAFTSKDGNLTLWHLHGTQWDRCPVDLEQVQVLDCGNLPGQLLVVQPHSGKGPGALQVMDGATGKIDDQPLLDDKAYDFNGSIFREAHTRTVVGVHFERNGPKSVWFDQGFAAVQKMVDGLFPDAFVQIIAGDEANKVFLVQSYSDRQPPKYSWVNIETKAAGLFENSAPWIDPSRMQRMVPFKFKTRDGRSLDAYITLPKGASKTKPPPLVVLPHDGPLARDSWGFNGVAQFLASRGYAVLQPNYRGSSGTQWLFPLEDDWAFDKMSNDVVDATKTVIAAGYVDGKRVGIMGTGFGGYLATMGIVSEPEIFRCAVDIGGVSDWEQQIGEKKWNQYMDPEAGRLQHKLGDPAKERERFEAISPARHVARIHGAVFVAHARDDGAVEVTQSRHLISELERNHVPVESFIVGEEGQGFGHLDKQVELYQRIEKFLDTNLSPRS